MRVGLTACCLNTPHIRGMGKYVYELLAASHPGSDVQWTLFANDPSTTLRHPPSVPIEKDIFEFRGDRLHLWDQVGLPLRTRGHNLDLLHCTESELPLWQPIPTVVTLHDTLAWSDREQRPIEALYYEKLLPAALRACDAVITISASSRHDIVQKWPSVSEKIWVVHHGIDAGYFRPPVSDLSVPLMRDLAGSRYVVYMGGPLKRKRFRWAVEVVRSLGRPGVKLVACGFSGAAREAAEQELPVDVRDLVIFSPFLSEDELRSLYHGAVALLYPTLYEGFGFPAVEAQASGTPAIFSLVSSLRELAGPLALTVPADDMHEWISAVQRAFEMPQAERRQRGKAALEWAKAFSWSESWKGHLAVYQHVLDKRASRGHG